MVGGPVGDFFKWDGCGGGDGGELRGGDDGILEVGAGAAGVGVVGDDEHALGAADVADGGGYFGERRPGASGEVALEVGVAERGGGVGVEPEVDAVDDVAAGFVGVETAGAVAEVTGGIGELDEGVGSSIVGVDGGDGLRDLLAVGADVLDGRSADGAGDAGEALDAGETAVDGVLNEGVPGLAGADGEEVVTEGSNAADLDVEDEAVEAGVTDEEIAAAAEDEEREGVLVGEGDGLGEVGGGGGFGEETGRATDLEGGEGG